MLIQTTAYARINSPSTPAKFRTGGKYFTVTIGRWKKTLWFELIRLAVGVFVVRNSPANA